MINCFFFSYRNTSAKLFADDCFDLAKERLYGNNPLQITGGVDYAVAIEWAEAALEYVRLDISPLV